jgi:hypothetical protein
MRAGKPPVGPGIGAKVMNCRCEVRRKRARLQFFQQGKGVVGVARGPPLAGVIDKKSDAVQRFGIRQGADAQFWTAWYCH